VARIARLVARVGDSKLYIGYTCVLKSVDKLWITRGEIAYRDDFVYTLVYMYNLSTEKLAWYLIMQGLCQEVCQELNSLINQALKTMPFF